MKIYTKTGDAGQTSLFDGKIVPKHDPRVATYGDIDELNAWLGVVASGSACGAESQSKLHQIQRDLFALGAQLANPTKRRQKAKADFAEARVIFLEQEIDRMENDLSPMKSFILPGGHPLSAQTHFARTICRRAERHLTKLHADDPFDLIFIRYINRLSDYLFVLARWFNHQNSVSDIPWE